MMKNSLIIAGCIVLTAVVASCGTRRSPGRAYMPDMTYSRAYETYAPAQERLNNSGAEMHPQYNNRPVIGTIARGDLFQYPYKNDSIGYAAAAGVKSPLDAATINMKESERLYLVNCGICHGAKLDGNGPLYNDGNGPYTAAPKNFMGADMKAMAEGTMFHSATYGKGQMGSYASQLNTRQRWMVIAYIKSKQGGVAGSAPDSAAATMPAKVDSAATAKK